MDTQPQHPSDLGKQIGVYKKSGVSISIKGIVAGALMMGVGFLIGEFTEPGNDLKVVSILGIFAGMFVIPGSLIALAIALSRPFKSVTLYQDGFVHEARGETVTVRWQEITQVIQRLRMIEGEARWADYTVVRNDGRSFFYGRAAVTDASLVGQYIIMMFKKHCQTTDFTENTFMWKITRISVMKAAQWSQ
jgi:hypothetical protein